MHVTNSIAIILLRISYFSTFQAGTQNQHLPQVHQESKESKHTTHRSRITSTMSWGTGSPPGAMKERLEFDLTQLFNLQSQYRNFTMYMNMHPLETKVKSTSSTPEISLKERSIYDVSEIKNHWRPEDENNDKEAKRKAELIAIYDLSKFPFTNSNASNNCKDNAENRVGMKALLEKLMKEELERLVNTAVETFDQVYLGCDRCKQTHLKCMTPAITSMFVAMHMEMRQADPANVTQSMADSWMRTFEKVKVEYHREFAQGEGACDKIVEAKRELKETWVCTLFYVTSFARKALQGTVQLFCSKI
jgi:hypothetical protein